jgi:hypothetical protein
MGKLIKLVHVGERRFQAYPGDDSRVTLELIETSLRAMGLSTNLITLSQGCRLGQIIRKLLKRRR